MKKTLALTLLTTSLLSTSALALTQHVSLDMAGTKLKGPSTIPLKREMRMQTGIKAKDWKLTKLQIVAKSKKGMGKATVAVNGMKGLSSTVPGTEALFQSETEGFSLVNVDTPNLYRGEVAKTMQLKTKGKIKLKNISLTLKKKLPARLLDIQRLPLTKVASIKASKVVGSSKTIRPSGVVKGIALTGTKGKVSINKVEIIKANGQKIILDEIKGRLKKGRTKGLILPRGLQTGIVKIKVSATSANLFGSRGKLDIKLAR